MDLHKVKEALENLIAGNDLAFARQESMASWPGSAFRRQAKEALAEFEKPAEDEMYKNLYLAARKCILNRWPYEDESGIIRVQLHDFGGLIHAYEAIKTNTNADDEIQQYAEAYHEQRVKQAQEIMDLEPRGMIASGTPSPLSLNAQLQRCEAYHAKQCAECTRGKKQYYPLGLEPLPGYEPD